MRKIEPEFITGMGYIGASPGVLYHMGGAGEQTVVTGNPALLEGVKGNRFTSITLHGKSMQGSTTGAQLFPPPSIGSVEKNGITLDYMEDGKIHIRGTAEITTDFYVSRLQLSAATYTLSMGVKIDTRVLRVALVDDIGVPYFDVRSDYTTDTIKKPIEVELLLRVFTGKTIDLTVQPMFNSGSTPLPWEPYTGGKPSPSPEYPQGIESAGDVGEIALNVLGKNLIPFKEIPKSTSNGITITTKSNGIVHFKGTATADYDSPTLSLQGVSLPKGRYLIFLHHNTIMLQIVVKKMAGNIIWYANIAIIEDGDELLYCYFTILKGATVNEDAYVYMQMDNGGTLSKSDFEPYKPAQKLIIPTSGGLPGIPVSSGGNYTDEKGQQWVCDEVDFKKGVYVQRVAKEIPKTSFNVKETVDVEGRYSFTSAFKNIYKNGSNKCLISHGIYGSWGIKKNTWAITSTAFIYSPAERTTVDKIKEKILPLINSDNPLTFLGQLETPIEIPLTTDQLAKYKALKTYSPTTTVINDAGAGMSVGYRRK